MPQNLREDARKQRTAKGGPTAKADSRHTNDWVCREPAFAADPPQLVGRVGVTSVSTVPSLRTKS